MWGLKTACRFCACVVVTPEWQTPSGPYRRGKHRKTEGGGRGCRIREQSRRIGLAWYICIGRGGVVLHLKLCQLASIKSSSIDFLCPRAHVTSPYGYISHHDFSHLLSEQPQLWVWRLSKTSTNWKVGGLIRGPGCQNTELLMAAPVVCEWLSIKNIVHHFYEIVLYWCWWDGSLCHQCRCGMCCKALRGRSIRKTCCINATPFTLFCAILL